MTNPCLYQTLGISVLPYDTVL